ncbi:YciI family protein [Paenibacillus radicis (ex Xue et al. 2023)]|uniref:YciI family protein n=1 Tax=Paenibacillus radicis (ex Xue et al. 2023) TaxID=2972489 RepID=A0ABT1YG57_9BACL|nr:YciI family protein [Paenibacillus radicis (ex Xue et al. 2023)]MCR8632179.1 YciI family protein [Paenibacillus radicis (ex Xue et al. 2023)]
MHFTLMFFETPEDFAARKDPERQQEYLAGWSHYVHALRDSGVVVSGFGLHAPETAATIQRSDGKMFVQDGPFTETKEQLGGLFVIDVPDLDTALEWAARAPVNAIEVRQNLPSMK